jgi:hypothetical protein
LTSCQSGYDRWEDNDLGRALLPRLIVVSSGPSLLLQILNYLHSDWFLIGWKVPLFYIPFDRAKSVLERKIK